MAKRNKKIEEAMEEELSSLKKQLPSTEKVKEVAELQHQKEAGEEQAEEPYTEPPKKKVRTTFEFPAKLHQAAKKASADEFLTLKDYVIMLLKKDLRERGYL